MFRFLTCKMSSGKRKKRKKDKINYADDYEEDRVLGFRDVFLSESILKYVTD